MGPGKSGVLAGASLKDSNFLRPTEIFARAEKSTCKGSSIVLIIAPFPGAQKTAGVPGTMPKNTDPRPDRPLSDTPWIQLWLMWTTHCPGHI